MLPNPELKRESAFVLTGEIPSPIALATGCPLAPRCPLCSQRCTEAFPPSAAVTATHRVYCYRHDEVARQESAIDIFGAFQRAAERVLSI